MKYIIILIIIFMIYVIAENRLILCTRHEKTGSGIKIAHISDLHKRRFGRNNIRITDILSKENPDVIFITGDIVSRNETDFETVENFLKDLCKISPVFIISGNHEQSLPDKYQAEFINMLGNTKAVFLRNDNCKFAVNGREVSIYGVEPPYTTYKKNHGYKNLDGFELQDMERLAGKRPGGEILLLAHNPLFGETYSQWGADYTFSGHVHGGVVRLFGKGLLSPERKFFPKYSKGIYDINQKKLCVSAGLGKLRLFNPPEIVVYEI